MSSPLAKQLRSKAVQLRAMADDLEAEAERSEALGAPVSADWLSMRELSSEYRFTRQSLAQAAANGLPVSKGPKGRLMVKRSDVEAWLAGRDWTPAKPKAKAPADLDEAHAAAARALGVAP